MAPHGSPYDRGQSDAEYGRDFRPHKKLQHPDHGLYLDMIGPLTLEELLEYTAGYAAPECPKAWGTPAPKAPHVRTVWLA